VNNLSDIPDLIRAITESGDPIDVDVGGGMTWLHVAAYGGSLDLVKALVNDLNAPIDGANDRGQTPLWIACLGGYVDIALFLLEREADPNIHSTSGLYPLHHMPCFDDSDVPIIAHALVEAGAEVNVRGPDDMTPLHYAIRGSGLSQTEPAVATLLALGADPLLKDDDGETALHAAVFCLREIYVSQMLQSSAIRDLSEEQLNEILADIFRTFIGQIKRHRLCQGSARYLPKLKTLVGLLYRQGVVEKYISAHLNGYSPLHDAYKYYSVDIAAEILKIVAPEMINMLSTKGHGVTPLFVAISNNIAGDDVEVLLQAGADFLLTARTGENVIHYCVEYASGLAPKFCSLIEERLGRDGLKRYLNMGTENKKLTPLDYALITEDKATAKFLINRGADVACCQYVKGDPVRWSDISSQVLNMESGGDVEIIRET
jgi:ankyrin repeat protein